MANCREMMDKYDLAQGFDGKESKQICAMCEVCWEPAELNVQDYFIDVEGRHLPQGSPHYYCKEHQRLAREIE